MRKEPSCQYEEKCQTKDVFESSSTSQSLSPSDMESATIRAEPKGSIAWRKLRLDKKA